MLIYWVSLAGLWIVGGALFLSNGKYYLFVEKTLNKLSGGSRENWKIWQEVIFCIFNMLLLPSAFAMLLGEMLNEVVSDALRSISDLFKRY